MCIRDRDHLHIGHRADARRAGCLSASPRESPDGCRSRLHPKELFDRARLHMQGVQFVLPEVRIGPDLVRCSGISAARHFAAAALISTTALAMAQSGGQPAKPGVGQSTDASPELKSLVGAAVALPVEYQSDILIDLIEKGKVSDPRWKGQLLEDLFHHAGEAKNPYPEVDSGESNDTVSARQGFAFLSGLDSLSIQCRVVRLVLNGSGRKARELFTQIVHPLSLIHI